MITYTTAQTKADLEGVLELQKANLTRNLSPEEIKNQGFVTIQHSYKQLAKLNEIEAHLIAKDGDRVIAYLLAMTAASKNDIAILDPLFESFDKLEYKGIKIADYKYLVVGQVCVDKDYRGQGILDACYAAYKQFFGRKYDFAITEIARHNVRSLKGHQRVGFKEIHSHQENGQTEWVVVIWDWKENY
ncbi:GNAT family N-acetyltransferase [Haliscomenobacter sp.]|uniref:GNAT family N-acetyltransferase n=1 Tax=Haliscomenobacter sp. TaxID=2717303 RepID=UPI003BAB1603